MPLTPQQRSEVEAIFNRTVENAFRRLGDLNLASHAINPFLAVFVARRPHELAEFIVHQRVERGLVTSFGMQLQKIVSMVGDNIRPSGVEGADLERVDPRTKRHILAQLKSGPDTVNRDIANQIRSNLNSAEHRLRTGGLGVDWSVTKMLGMIYGTQRHRSSWVLNLGAQGFDVDKIGRSFWEFASGDANTHIEIFEVAANVAYNYRDANGRTLPEAIRGAVSLLTTQLQTHYSNAQGDIDWSKLLEENM